MNATAVKNPATVLILGAGGRFGLAAAHAFATAGWRVLAQMRAGAQVPAQALGDRRVQWIFQDLNALAQLTDAAAGASVVVHALNPANTNKAWRAKSQAMLDGSIQVARAVGATLMLPGNVYNFGADMPRVLHENTPQQARTVKGQVRIAMEAQLQSSGVRSVVIRAGNFFGSGSGSWFDKSIVKDLKKGIIIYPGPRGACTAWAYLPDLARTFVEVAARRDAVNTFEVYHFAGYGLTAQHWLEVLTPIAQAQGWLQPGAAVTLKGLPWGVIRVGGWFNPVWASLVEMRYLWERPHILANDKLVALLGAEPHTPLEQAACNALLESGMLASPLGCHGSLNEIV